MKSTKSEHLSDISPIVGGYEPRLLPRAAERRAAVALVLRQGRECGLEMLFIQRATAKADPWSGQIAFPGGGQEPSDRILVDTAIREANEEVGVVLEPAQKIGRLDDQQGRHNNRSLPLIISCFVFALGSEAVLTPNYEVTEVFWTPLHRLQQDSYRFFYQTPYRQEPYPAIDLGPGEAGQPRILWGLTYRFVCEFLKIIGGGDGLLYSRN